MAGALTARALDRRGVHVVVLDAGEKPGGIAQASEVDGFTLEPAAGSVLLPHPHLSPLLEGLDVTVVPANEAARRRLVHIGGETVEVPMGAKVLRWSALSPRARARALMEPSVRSRSHEGESVDVFMRRRLGDEAGRLAAWFMAAGVHAGDPAALSIAAAFPRLAAMESAYGSLLRAALAGRRSGRSPAHTHTIEGGTAAIADAVRSSLGGRWLSKSEVISISSGAGRWTVRSTVDVDAREIVLAIPGAVSARLLGVEGIVGVAAPVAVVWLGLDRRLPDAIGALVGPDEHLKTLGFSYESSYAPTKAPMGAGLLKAIVGGALNPDIVDRSDRDLIDLVQDEATRVLGERLGVTMSHVVRHRPGIPQSTAARRRDIASLEDSLPAGIHLAGWDFDGVGLNDLATAACIRADRLGR